MQVMPFHSGQWGCASKDLFNIERHLPRRERAGADDQEDEDLNRALLAYNGCVKGRNTKNCQTYPSKVMKARGLPSRR